MKTKLCILLYLMIIVGIVSGCKDKPVSEPVKDIDMKEQDAITQTVLDYIEGWYGGDGERMGRAVSEHLSKRQFNPDGEIRDVTRDKLIEITGSGRGRLDNPETGRKEITILDQTGTMASVKLVSNDFIDYMHLEKIDGTWVIINVLWDYLPR